MALTTRFSRVWTGPLRANRFNGQSSMKETVETVNSLSDERPTPLKWGVNESAELTPYGCVDVPSSDLD